MHKDTLSAINDSLAENRRNNIASIKKAKDLPDVEYALTKHEINVRDTIQEALANEPHALSCGDVYNEVVKVAQEENKKAKGG